MKYCENVINVRLSIDCDTFKAVAVAKLYFSSHDNHALFSWRRYICPFLSLTGLLACSCWYLTSLTFLSTELSSTSPIRGPFLWCNLTNLLCVYIIFNLHIVNGVTVNLILNSGYARLYFQRSLYGASMVSN